MYVCGPTVYDTPHLGNARPAVVFDVLYRLLKASYPQVVYARNFTDIDDKIMDRAALNGEPIADLTRRTTEEYLDVVDALGCLVPNHMPRATAFIQAMVVTIEQLIESGHAYVSEGHVLFSVPSFPEHGALSRHDQENLRSGHRVEVASYKRDPSDFILWKPSSADQPGWDSPWGRGRPGWHIECSAMIRNVLGLTIDIHGGGADLRFPHHDCEISQSTCAFGAPPARYWLHNGMVLADGEKMAKSVGNFTTPRDLITAGVAGDALRLALLSAHYRSPLDWSPATIQAAEQALERWRNALRPFKGRVAAGDPSPRLLEALSQDLNTPLAISVIHDLVSDLNQHPDAQKAAVALGSLTFLGFLPEFERRSEGPVEEIEALIAQRNAARAVKDFASSDALRAQLEAMGVHLRDGKSDTQWWFI